MTKLTKAMRDFRRDRIGGNSFNQHHSRITYLAHGKGWVMCRHRGCTPFVVPEREWLAFTLYEHPAGRAALKEEEI